MTTIKEAAERMGVSELTIRIGLQQGVFPFGAAFKRDPANKNYTYVIYDKKFAEYIGNEQKGASNENLC